MLLKFYEADELDKKKAIQAYLLTLQHLARLSKRDSFLNLFPKGCGGCFSLQMFCIVYLHKGLAIEVFDLFRILFNDENGAIVNSCEVYYLFLFIICLNFTTWLEYYFISISISSIFVLLLSSIYSLSSLSSLS